MRRLAVALMAAGLLVWLAAPALSARPFVPRVVEFQQALGALAVPAQRSRSWRSPVIRAPRRFDLIGLRWRASAAHDEHARIRVHDADTQRWSRWTLMAADHAGGAGAEPVWAGGADAYQLRLDRRPRGLRAHFVNATGTATQGARVQTALRRAAHGAIAALAGAVAGAQGGAPAIVPRATWAGDQCAPRGTPSYGSVQMGFVHHTVNANEYGPQDSAAVVLAICRYHLNANGWNDVGYNFLVDRFGQVFEGRAGGIDKAVVGAQAQGFNSVSTGVANIGTFSGVGQTPEGLRATAELLAWKLTLHGAPVAGTLTVASGGGSSNRHPAGSAVTFERIAAHREADRTACPGDALFAQLPQVRQQAAALAPAYAAPAPSALTLDALDRTLALPQLAQLSGLATGVGGGVLAGAAISIQVATANGFATIARTTARGDGTWSAEVPTQYSRTLRAVALLPGGGRVQSAPVEVQVAPLIRLRAARRVTVRRQFTVSGSMRPRRGQLVLEIARAGTDRRMHTVARVPMKVRGGRYSMKVRLRRPALHRLRASFAGDARNVAGRSGDVYLRAVRGAGARPR